MFSVFYLLSYVLNTLDVLGLGKLLGALRSVEAIETTREIKNMCKVIPSRGFPTLSTVRTMDKAPETGGWPGRT